jgi:CHAD domain-containing protein
MAKKFKAKLDRSLRENAAELFPLLLKEVMSYKERVISHPEDAEALHQMRIAGRPMRYVMEAFAPAFGKSYGKKLKELKNLLEIAGDVHDCDVMMGMLGKDVAPPEGAPQGLAAVGLPPRGMTALLEAERNRRNAMYSKLCDTLASWDARKFRDALARTLEKGT